MASSKTKNVNAVMGDVSNDITLPLGPQDTVSTVRWAPIHDYLAASSWDSKIYIYDVSVPQSAKGLAAIPTHAPVFDCDFNQDETLITAAGADGVLHIIDPATLQRHCIADAHAKPIRACRFVDAPATQGSFVVATGSWDATVRYWDLRQKLLAPSVTISVGERVYAMDAVGPMLAVATADSKLSFFDIRSVADSGNGPVTTSSYTRNSPLSRQNTCLALSKKASHVATGAIDGRVGVQDTRNGTNFNSFTWRCHRSQPIPVPPTPTLFGPRNSDGNNRNRKQQQHEVKVYAVNSVAYSPIDEDVVASAGSDGTFHFWNTKRMSRLCGFSNVGGPITGCAFSAKATLFAYAVGDDWARGYSGAKNDRVESKVVVHAVGDREVGL